MTHRFSLRRAVADAVLREVESANRSRVVLVITGPGGTGKTALLGDVGDALNRMGIATTYSTDDVISADDRCALLLDDAHTLSADQISEVADVVRRGSCHVVLARRQWPQPAALRRLVASVSDSHLAVTLGPMSAAEIAAFGAATLGRPLSDDDVDLLAAATSGLPWLVKRVAAAWDTAGADPVVSESVQVLLSDDIAGFDPTVTDLLLELAVGFDLAGHASPPALEQHSDHDLITRAAAEGVLDRDSRLPPVLADAVLAAAPPHRVRRLRMAYLDTLDRGGLEIDIDTARVMARVGVRHPILTRALLDGAHGAAVHRPALALELFDEAVATGADAGGLAVHRARAMVAMGDIDGAARIVDDVLARPEGTGKDVAADVASAVWSRRGMLGRGADIYRWLGPARVGVSGPLAAVTMYATGDAAGADEMLSASNGGSPTDLGAALRLMADGLRLSLGTDAARAHSELLRASDTLNALGSAVPLPTTPAVVAAHVAMNAGEVTLAGSVLDEALRARQGGPMMRADLILHRGWVAMLLNRPADAAAALVDARRLGLHGRDACLAAALDVGLARRAYDPAVIMAAWRRARGLLLRWPIDVFAVRPLAELQMAAARVGESGWLASQIGDTWALLDTLGHPVHWAVPLHWGSLHAALATERAGDVRTHLTAIQRAAAANPIAAAMAPAGRAWVKAAGKVVDAGEVENAAVGLAHVGLAWDGARLVSFAATRATDRKDQARLLAKARDLRPAMPGGPSVRPAAEAPVARQATPQRPRPPAGAVVAGGAAVAGTVPGPTGVLSERERQVAALVVAGRTYREIGAALFMSPRTAEHHVARMRSRLGASDRADLLSRLRAELGDAAGITH